MYYLDFSVFYNRIKLDLDSGEVPSPELLKEIIILNGADRAKKEKLYARYVSTIQGAPIRKRIIDVEGKPNNKIENNFMKKIVNTKVGYYASKIDYQLDKNEYKIEDSIKNTSYIDPIYYEYLDELQDFSIRSNTKKLDSNIAKMMGVCGYGVKNLFIVDSQVYAQNINPWETVFISDTERPNYCLRYYTIMNLSEKGLVPNLKIDFYDTQYIYSYIEEGDINIGGNLKFISKTPHYMNGLPMIQFKNNHELSPDCDDSVLSLIDAYDVCISDGVNEIDGLAQAYLVLVNMVLGNNSEEAKNTLTQMKQTGVVQVGENGEANFITKNINDTFFQNILNRLEQNIYTFASSVNLNDQNFANNSSGVAMKYKLLALETVSVISENEFKAATLEMFRILTGFWALQGYEIDYLDIFINMKRNFPLDLESEARSSAQLKGLVSEETRLSQLSFIDDVNYEIEMMQQDLQNENNPYNLDNNINDNISMDNQMKGSMMDVSTTDMTEVI